MQSAASAHLQVGVNANSDASLLEGDHGVDVANTVDVRTHARECWVETPSRSLAGMTGALIGKELPKDPTIRFSRWSSGSLTSEQMGFRKLCALLLRLQRFSCGILLITA
ncbi:unnamed protein product [Sphacelaria rigidula]